MSIAWLLWRKFTWRHWRQAPRTTTVLVLILAVGVGMVLAIALANRAAVAGFELFTRTVTGTSDAIVTAPAGRLRMDTLPALRQALDGEPVYLFPVLESVGQRPGESAATFSLVGTDLLAAQNLAYADDFAAAGNWLAEGERSMAGLLQDRRAVFVPPAAAETHGLRAGDELTLLVGDKRVTLQVATVLPEYGGTQGGSNLLVMDLFALQAITDLPGEVDRVEARVADGPAKAARRARLRELLAAGAEGRWVVGTPASRRSTGEVMTRAFRLNLFMLSGLALLIGMYLVLQALEGAVVKRRSEMAVMRSLGVTGQQLRWAWMREAAALGLVGSAVGVVLGVAAAQLAVLPVARTVNTLYYQTTASAAQWHGPEVLLAVGLGTLASVLAGWLPARDAAATPPAQVLARGGRSRGPRVFRHPALGLGLVVLGLGLYVLPPVHLGGGTRFPAAGYLAGLCWIVGATSLAGAMFAPLAGVAVRIGRHHAPLAYAGSQFRLSTGRHYLTLAGLLLAVGMALGMAILIHSFETTIRGWIGQMLQADLFVAPVTHTGVNVQARLSRDTWQRLADDPDVREVDLAQAFAVRQGQVQVQVQVMGVELHSPERRDNMVWIAPPRQDLAERRLQPDECLVSEAYSRRFDVAVGDEIRVPTPAGTQQLTVLGIYADYGSEHGTILVRLKHLWRWFNDRQAVSVAAYVREGVDPETVRQRWARAFPALAVRTHGMLRQEILRIFRQTFAITYALQVMAMVVAVTGLALALASLMLERRDELRTLKELGMGRGDIALATAWEGAGLSLVGVLGGTLLSLALGSLLVFVINKQSFGWTLGFAVPWRIAALLGGTILLVGSGVAYAVGYFGASVPADREE